jgi:hypothetical protein
VKLMTGMGTETDILYRINRPKWLYCLRDPRSRQFCNDNKHGYEESLETPAERGRLEEFFHIHDQWILEIRLVERPESLLIAVNHHYVCGPALVPECQVNNLRLFCCVHEFLQERCAMALDLCLEVSDRYA